MNRKVKVTIEVTFDEGCSAVDELVDAVCELMDRGGQCSCEGEIVYSINQTMTGGNR